MTDSATLTIDIQGYWHTGTGRGSGSHLDALVDTHAGGLPYLSGRHLKGLLRDAVYKAEQWGRLDAHKARIGGEKITDLLFGKRYTDPETRVPRDDTTAGLLRIGDGLLPEALRTWLTHSAQQDLREHFYRELSSTRIEDDSGVAKSRSLRGIQVTVPLRLEAAISTLPRLHGDEPQALDWQCILADCLPLIRAVGAQRTRGLGRAVLTLHDGGPQ